MLRRSLKKANCASLDPPYAAICGPLSTCGYEGWRALSSRSSLQVSIPSGRFSRRFYEAGCDDATIAFQNGHIIADFACGAPSLAEAIASAVAAVKKAGAKVERIEPDPLVSLSDMATRAGLTRAAMTNYFKGTRAEDFPAAGGQGYLGKSALGLGGGRALDVPAPQARPRSRDRSGGRQARQHEAV